MILTMLITMAAASGLGHQPPSAQMKSAIMQAADAKLIDGASARYKWPNEDRGGVVYCGWVNAKNRMGGYTGWSPFISVGGHEDGPKGDGSYAVGQIYIGSDNNEGADNAIIAKFCPAAGFDTAHVPAD